MNYLIFCQTPYDSVKYITNEMQEYTSMSYKKFVRFLMSQKINNYVDIQKQLDSFKTIFLNTITGEYKELLPDFNPKFTFEQLVEANPPALFIKEQAEVEVDPMQNKKDYLQKLFRWRKENDYVNRHK